MKQAFYNHVVWEDYQHGMYKSTCDDSANLIQQCVKLLGNHYVLKSVMRSCSNKWKYAAAQNMSNASRNRQAWLGQASCCYSVGAPEFITKQAWRLLTDEQRTLANKVADEIIKEWESEYVRDKRQTTLFN